MGAPHPWDSQKKGNPNTKSTLHTPMTLAETKLNKKNMVSPQKGRHPRRMILCMLYASFSLHSCRRKERLSICCWWKHLVSWALNVKETSLKTAGRRPSCCQRSGPLYLCHLHPSFKLFIHTWASAEGEGQSLGPMLPSDSTVSPGQCFSVSIEKPPSLASRKNKKNICLST